MIVKINRLNFRQQTFVIAKTGLCHTGQETQFELWDNGPPWERLAALTCKRMHPYLKALRSCTPLQLTATLGLQPDLADVSRRDAESEYLICAIHQNFSKSEGASTIRSLLCGRAPAWNCPWSSLNPPSSAIARALPFQNGLWVLHSHPHPKEIQLDDFSSVCFIQLFRNTTQTPIIMRCLC